MADGPFKILGDAFRRSAEEDKLKAGRRDIESLAGPLLNALGVNPTPQVPFNEETFFNEKNVSHGTNIGQVIETPGTPDFTGADNRRQGNRPSLTFTTEQRKAFGRILGRNPKEANQLLFEVLGSQNANKKAAFKKEADQITKDNIFLEGAKTPLELLGRIRQLASEPGISKARKRELKTILDSPDFDKKKLLIEKNILDGRDLDKVFTEKETRRLETAKTVEAKRVATAKIVETKRAEAVKATEAKKQRGAFVDVKDSQGNIMGSRNSITNEFKPVDTSFFAKPRLDNFTQKSVQKYIKSKNPGDLVAVDEGPSDQILSAFIPFMFGGVDFEDPQEMAQAFARFNMIGAGLSNKTPEEMQALALKIEALRPKIEEEPDDPGLLEELGAFLKQVTSGNAPQGIKEIPQAKPTPAPARTQEPQAGEPTATLEEAKKAIPGVQVDEDGFLYLPNINAVDGKQFIKNKRGKGGQRIKVK